MKKIVILFFLIILPILANEENKNNNEETKDQNKTIKISSPTIEEQKESVENKAKVMNEKQENLQKIPRPVFCNQISEPDHDPSKCAVCESD